MKNGFIETNNTHGKTCKLQHFIMPDSDFDPCIKNFSGFPSLTKLSPPPPKKSRKLFHNIIAGDPKMLEVFDHIKSVADYDCPVHITGETGTGKELVARAIHNQSPRKDGPFVPINCGALPEGLVESELFGHIKGAFSGAIKNKKGRFELADGGTLFLDEVAELSKPMQVKLLRALQEGIIEKVGSESSFAVNTRIISATNKNLKAEITGNNFRSDLYYRLCVFPIQLPPLSQRKKDIFLLADHFINETCHQYKKNKLTLSHKVCELFEKYHWPGNVRELQNVIWFAIIKSKTDIITPDCLPLEFSDLKLPAFSEIKAGKLDFDSVKDALLVSGWNKTKAAKRLKVGRATLYRFLESNNELLEETA